MDWGPIVWDGLTVPQAWGTSTVWGPWVEGPQTQAYRLGSPILEPAMHSLGWAYSLGAYSIQLPILEAAMHSLD